MAALGWLLNLGFAGGTAAADPPTSQPLRVSLATSLTNNGLVMQKSANSVDPVKSKNSVTLA